MGLIAREIEARGIATISLSSALSITQAVNPPRAVYIDFPLGHTSGKPHDKGGQRRIMIDTLSALESIQEPGTIRPLPYTWVDDPAATADWKARAFRSSNRSSSEDSEASTKPSDDRVARHDTPQYQTEADAAAARQTVAGGGCSTCVFLSDT